MAVGSDGVYLSGCTLATGSKKPLLAKYDFAGKLIYDYAFPWDGSANAVGVDKDGNVYIAGVKGGSSGNQDAFLAKFNSSGGSLWETIWGGVNTDTVTNIAVAAGGVYVCGAATPPGAYATDAFIKKFNFAGGEVASATIIATNNYDHARGIATDASENVYVAGSTYVGSQGAGFVAKYNAGLGQSWLQTEVGESAERVACDDLLETVYACGYASRTGGMDGYVAQCNAISGVRDWRQTFSGGRATYATGVGAGDSGPVVAGWSQSGEGFLHSFDDRGVLVDSHSFGSGVWPNALDMSSGQTAYVAGTLRVGGGTNRAFVAKLGGRKVLQDVPDYRYNYGCAPTVAGMLMAYWDYRGYDLVGNGTLPAPLTSSPQTVDRPREGHREATTYETGSPNSSLLIDQLIASVGHHRDYWAHGLDSEEGANIDPMLAHHTKDCLADYLGTSKGQWRNGETAGSAIAPGLRDWVRYRDGQWTVGANDTRPDFEKVKSQIDGGSPVILLYLLDGLGSNGHFVLAYGYCDFGPNDQWVAVRDTWQDGDSNGDDRVRAFLDSQNVEWWKWSTRVNLADPLAYVYQMNTFSLRGEWRVTSLSDSFDRLFPMDLGYTVRDSSVSGSGTVSIASAPSDPNNKVLQLTSSTGEPIAVVTEVDVTGQVELSFKYLFGDAGTIEMYVGQTRLDSFDSPTSGAGAPGSQEFATYDRSFDLSSLGIDLLSTQEFRLVLKGVGDPTLYVDDLTMISVPEPSTIVLLSIGAVGLLGFVWRRRRRTA